MNAPRNTMLIARIRRQMKDMARRHGRAVVAPLPIAVRLHLRRNNVLHPAVRVLRQTAERVTTNG
jgi:hypothetical protein